MRLLSNSISLLSRSITRINRGGKPIFIRLFSQQQLSISHEETLTGRILIYLNPENGSSPKAANNTLYTLKKLQQNVGQLHKLSTNEIIHFSSILNQQNITRNELLFILRELDTACYSRLSEMTSADILKLLNVYMKIIPSRITEFRFYKQAIKVLYESSSNLNKKDLLQLIFYVGLQKKNPESQLMLRYCIRKMDDNFVKSLTLEELCIICNSTFKTSTKLINKTLLEKVRSFINDNLYVLNDSALFVTLLKTLRHNRHQDDDLLSTISCGVFFNKTFALYSFPVICHILALFADHFYYDKHLFELFTQQCLKDLSGSTFISKRLHLTQQLRGKDIKRFLWIASMFSEMKIVSQSDIHNVIMPKLMERVEAGEFSSDVDSLVDINLFLWMLNYRSKELVPYIFKKSAKSIAVNPKSNLRLNLLLYAIYSEDPDLAEQLQIKSVKIPSNVYSNYQLHKRPFLQKLHNTLNAIRKELEFEYFDYSQEIPHLNIVGITGYKSRTRKAVYVEVLDDYNQIKNIQDDVPVGLMALKLRLLDRLEEGVLVVSQKESKEMTDSELKEYLLDEMKLIC